MTFSMTPNRSYIDRMNAMEKACMGGAIAVQDVSIFTTDIFRVRPLSVRVDGNMEVSRELFPSAWVGTTAPDAMGDAAKAITMKIRETIND